VAITVPLSYVVQFAKAGIVAFPTPLSELSINRSRKTATITTNVTGGDADVSVLYGSLDVSGKIHFARVHPARVATLGSMQLDVGDAEVVATPAGSSEPVVPLDVTGDITTSVTPGTTSTTLQGGSDRRHPVGDLDGRVPLLARQFPPETIAIHLLDAIPLSFGRYWLTSA
jgi:hypothetical protein